MREVRRLESLLEPAASQNIPVHYVTVTYRTRHGSPPASQMIVWPPTVRFDHHIFRMLRMRGFEAHVTFGEDTISDSNRKTLAEALWRAVRKAFIPLE